MAGSTGVGSVTSIGSSVSNVGVNDKVLVVSSGVWTDNITVPASSVLKIPSSLSVEDSANLPSVLSAYAILNNFIKLETGDIIVQNGGETAIGQAITQLAAAHGLSVISATAADYDDANYPKKIAAMGNVKLVITNSSKKTITKSLLRCLSPNGVMVVYNGEVAPGDSDGIDVPVGMAIFKANSIQGFDFNVWMSTEPKNVHNAMTAVAAHFDTKKITLKSKVYPQAEYLKAMQDYQKSQEFVVLKV